MKKIYSIFVIILVLSSCGEQKEQSLSEVIASKDLGQIRAKKSELDNKMQQISAEIKLLNTEIEILDTLKRVPLVTAIKLKNEVFTHFLELQGNVTTKQNVLIYPEVAGTLEKVFVKEGQKVTKGQVLARIDDGGLGQQLAQLQIQADLAKTTFERQKRLWDQKIGSEIQYLQAKSSYESQQQAVNQLKQQLAKTTVRAPFSGTIDDIITEQGSVVGAGQTQLIRIVNLDNMYIETEVPERYISNVVAGKNVQVEFAVLGKTIDTKVRQASDFINPANRTFKVEIAIPNKEKTIKPNLTAKLKINDYTSENALLVPQSIISENAEGEQYVYVVKNKNANGEGVANRVIIKTGKTQGDVIEVLEGIENGVEIIKEGARSVKDGQTVKVLTYETEKNG